MKLLNKEALRMIEKTKNNRKKYIPPRISFLSETYSAQTDSCTTGNGASYCSDGIGPYCSGGPDATGGCSGGGAV